MQNKETAKTASARRYWLLIVIIFACIIFLLSIIGLWITSTVQENVKTITIGNETFAIELADTESEREKGLSQRDSLGANKAMLFDFKQDDIWRIWMLNMRFPIDIAWLDTSGKIVYLKNNITPDTFPNAYYPDVPSRYVLEVNAGTFERLKVDVGDTVRLP
jgi:uncharacterized protein